MMIFVFVVYLFCGLQICLCVLSQSEKDEMLQAHNVYRCMAGVEPFVWDDWIANNAQTWINKGVYQHSGGSDLKYKGTTEMGENLALTGGTARGVVVYWYDEIRFTTPWGRATGMLGNGGNEVGHYTSMMWKTSTGWVVLSTGTLGRRAWE